MELYIPLRHPDFLTHVSGCLPRQPMQMPSVSSPNLERGRAQGESYQAQGHPQANGEWLVTTGCILHTSTPSLSGPTPSPESLLSGSLSVASHPESPLCSGNLSRLLKLVSASHLGLAFLHKACLSGLALHVQVRSHSRPCPSGSLCPICSSKALCPTFSG